MKRGTVVVPSASEARGTGPGLRRSPSSRSVRNSTLVVGAANSARNYPDATFVRVLSPGWSPGLDGATKDNTVLEQSAGLFALVAPPSYEVTFLEFLEVWFCRCSLYYTRSRRSNIFTTSAQITCREIRIVASRRATSKRELERM